MNKDLFKRLKVVETLNLLGFRHQEECNQYVAKVGEDSSLITTDGSTFYLVNKVAAEFDAVERPDDIAVMLYELKKLGNGRTTEQIAADYLADFNMNNDINI